MPVNNYIGHEVEDIGAFLGGGDDNQGNDTHTNNVTASENADILSSTTRKQKVMAMGQMLASTSKSRTALLVTDTQKGEREVCRLETITMMRSFPRLEAASCTERHCTD